MIDAIPSSRKTHQISEWLFGTVVTDMFKSSLMSSRFFAASAPAACARNYSDSAATTPGHHRFSFNSTVLSGADTQWRRLIWSII
jgi:hypothetical protein